MSPIEVHAADLRKVRCPACQRTQGGPYEATPQERAAFRERAPQAGDATIRLYCAALLIFDGKGGCRLASVAEMNGLSDVEKSALIAFSISLMKFRP